MKLAQFIKTETDQLELYCQSIADIHTGALSGAEALLRWNHPYKGLLAPAAFLSLCAREALLSRDRQQKPS